MTPPKSPEEMAKEHADIEFEFDRKNGSYPNRSWVARRDSFLAGFRAGEEAMREKCLGMIGETPSHLTDEEQREWLAKCLRAMPLESDAKEGK